MNVILEGHRIKSVDDFHQALSVILDLPDYYGANLDALWDCLTGWVDLPLTLTWSDFEKSKDSLGAFAQKALECFEHADKAISGFTFTKA